MVDRSKSLRDSLVSSGLLSEDQVKEAIEEGRRTNETLIKSMLRKGHHFLQSSNFFEGTISYERRISNHAVASY